MKYQTITEVVGYEYGIFSNGRAALESNGRRMRLIWDGVRWEGNSGVRHTFTKYMGREEGRKLLRRVREAQKGVITGKYPGGNTPLGILTGYGH